MDRNMCSICGKTRELIVNKLKRLSPYKFEQLLLSVSQSPVFQKGFVCQWLIIKENIQILFYREFR